MADLPIPDATTNPHLRAGAAALLVLLMTTVHHFYGAVAYDTPWRLHIVYVSLPVAAALVAALYVGISHRGTVERRAATWLAVAIIMIFPGALVGVFEGGYNHLVKNIVYFVAGEQAMMTLVPAWLYDPAAVEIPNFIFEATGIAQFPLGVLAMLTAWRLGRRTA